MPAQQRLAAEKLEHDATAAAHAEQEFGKGRPHPVRPCRAPPSRNCARRTFSSRETSTKPRPAGGGARPAGSRAQAAQFEARERAAQAQEEAARARAQTVLQHPWDENPHDRPAPSHAAALAGSGTCPQCNAESRSISDLHPAPVPAPAAPQPEKRGFWDSVYHSVADPVQSAYAKAVFVKQKMEEATGPVVSGVLEGIADTVAGVTIGALLWALGKLLAQLGIGALLSEVGVGEAIIALRLRQIMLAVGVVLTAVQLAAAVAALRRWISAKPGSPESTNALREFVRSTTGLVLALALLAALGIKGGGKPRTPPEPGTPPPNIHGALVEGAPPPASEPPSRLTPPEPQPQPVEPAPAQPGQGPTIKVTRDVGRHYFDDGVIVRRGDGIKMAHSRAKFETRLSAARERSSRTLPSRASTASPWSSISSSRSTRAAPKCRT